MVEKKIVLLIDATLHKKDATGITLSNLFGSWPKENLYMIGKPEFTELSRIEGYRNVYALDDKDYYHKFPLGFAINTLKLFKNKYCITKTGEFTRIKSSNTNYNSFTNLIFLRKLIVYIFHRLGLDHLFFRQVISADLRNWIMDTNPDFFYALLSTRHSILFAEKLVSEFQKPIIVHFMDDWPTTIGNKSFFYQFWNRKINCDLKRLLQVSHRKIGISELMAMEYSKRFGGDWLYFHNPVEVAWWRKDKAIVDSPGLAFNILYSGRLSAGISETLKSVCAAVDVLNHTTEFKISFQIQSSSRPGWIDNYRNSFFTHFIDYYCLPDLFSKADLLILPYDFEGPSFDFIRLSMPTKLTEYMASGTPILVIAPLECALSHFVEKFNVAHLVSSASVTDISTNLLLILENKELREMYSNNSIGLADSIFNKRKVEKNFLEVFQ
jgi:glycosyltransferase involved in cell wall biosynthesis